jgi:23S rRNA G2069 N7-methylase RlmK/C1962 C5-methylase RlmI
VLRVEGEAVSGDLVEVCAADGTRLAVAGYSPKSQIRARVWTREALDVDAAFLASQVRASVARRAGLLEAEALQACAYAIERLKQMVPIWKKEIWKQGQSTWVEAAK